MLNEIWHDSFHGQIPKENYEMQLLQGEQHGLMIHLYGPHHSVALDFGIVQPSTSWMKASSFTIPPA